MVDSVDSSLADWKIRLLACFILLCTWTINRVLHNCFKSRDKIQFSDSFQLSHIRWTIIYSVRGLSNPRTSDN